MNKDMLKILLPIVLLVAITEFLIPSIFGLNQGLITSFVNGARLNILYSKQIETQKREGRERSLPPQGEISKMQRDKTYCYENDDCRLKTDTLIDCNEPIHNKYFSCQGTLCAPQTTIGCAANMYFVCENNKCAKMTIEL